MTTRQLRFLPILIFLVVLAAYVRTLMPGPVGGDAGELQYAGPLLALVHPTGQPLYVLLGNLWSNLVPLGSVAYRMNLLAAVSAAAGCALLAWFVWRVFGNWMIALAAGLTLGFGATVWGQAVIADKYGFNVLLAALIVGLALWWERAAGEDHPHADRLLYALSLAFGIGLLHHRSLALFGVGIGLMVLYHLRAGIWRQWRRTVICLLLVFVPPLLVYPTVLPWLQAREVSPLLWQPTSAGEWVDFLLERHVLSNEALVFDDVGSIRAQLQIYAETLLTDYTVTVALVAALGVAVMFGFHPAAAVFLLVSYGLQAFLSANFRGNDRQFTYYLPSFVVLLYAYAYGLLVLWRWAGRQRLVGVVGSLLVLLVPVALFLNTYPDRRADATYGQPLDLWRTTLKTGDMGERLARGMDSLPENALLASDWEQVTILWYYQQVEGVRPDLNILYPIERYAEETEHPVCLARHVPVGDEFHPTNHDALICLNRERQFDLPSDITPIETTLYTESGEPVMVLAGYQAETPTYTAGTHAPLLLTWQALADIPSDYSISLQVLDESWNLVWSRDIQSPVMGMYPTSRWWEGEVVQDYHEINVPRTPGRYLWTVVVYRALPGGTFERLRDADGNINILGGTFNVER